MIRWPTCRTSPWCASRQTASSAREKQMKIRLRVSVGMTLSAIALSASLAQAQSQLDVADLSGTIRFQQDVPCGDPVDVTLTIIDGAMDIASRISTRGEATFDLVRLAVSVTPFSLHRACMGMSANADFREIGLQLAAAVRFTGEETGPAGSGQYRIVIPKEKFVLYESIV